MSEKSLRNGESHGFFVPATTQPGTLGLWPWTKREKKIASLALGGIKCSSPESKMEIPVTMSFP